MTKPELQQAGFTDIEIDSYFDDQRKSLSDAGFSPQEINTHYGQQTAVLENPDEAFKKGVEIMDLSVDLQLPLDTIESNYNTIMEIADPKDVSIHETIQAPYTEMRFEATPPKTTWQKVKGFFVSEREPLPPNPSRMGIVDRALHIAVDAPLRTFMRYASGKTFGADEIMWAGIKRITPDDMWVDEVKNMTLEEAMDWAAGYNPSGFVKMSGEIAEFIGRLGTARGIGVRTGLLGKTPKDISVLQKATEAAKLFGIAASAEQVSKAVSTKIDPTDTEYGFEGPKAVFRDMAIGAILSIAASGVEAVAKPIWNKYLVSQGRKAALKVLGLDKNASMAEIRKASIGFSKTLNPDKVKGYTKEFAKIQRAIDLAKPEQDIVFRGQKIKISQKLLTGKAPEAIVKPVTTPAKPPTAAPVAKPPTQPTDIPPKAVEAKPEAVDELAKFEVLNPKQEITVITETDTETMTVEDAVFRLDEITGESVAELEAGESLEVADEAKAITKELEKLLPEAVEKALPIKTVPERVAEVRESLPDAKLSRKPVKVDGKVFHPVSIPTEKIGVDPERFQFKLGARLAGGVTEAMKGVKVFDPVQAGQLLVWQDKAGKYWVIDGHHRVALAKRTGTKSLDTWVLREADGITATEARATGALRNLRDAKGTATDAAKLFRDSNISLEDLQESGVPTNSTIIKQGLDMADLSDEVFRLVVDERIPPNMAAIIGKHVKSEVQQKQVADLILEGEVDTVRQAELLAITIDSAPVLTKTEQTLFGLETTEKSLFAERAKVLDNVEKKLKTNKKVFGVLATRTGIIEAKGNILAKVENLAAKEQAEEVLFMLEKLVNSKGPIAEALNDATKEYAENPTKENLSKVTSELLVKWTEGPGRLRIPGQEGVSKLPIEGFGEPGFLDVEPLQKTFDAVLNILEPAKKTDISLGKDVSATVIRGIHKPDVAMIEFNEKTIENLDGTLKDFGEKLAKFSNKTLENLMLSRGKPATKEAIAIRNEALAALKKDAPELIGTRDMITKIADFNYKFLTDVVGDQINYVTDYFYGIYKDSKKVDRFLDFWKTTKRFTKEKKLPTVADAKAYGLDLRDPNPVNNLRSEYMAISRLDGMIWMRDELLRTGKDSYISDNPGTIKDAEKIPEPVFKGLWLDPELASLIKKLISSNKIAQVPALNALRKTNNFLRSIKFLFSAFHHGVIAKQAAADSGFLGFLYKPTALRGFSIGFRKNDPRFKTAEYKDYIEHGGGHRFSIDSEAQRAFTSAVNKLSKSSQLAVRIGTLPLRIPEGYIKWLFESYIPEIKYGKYLDVTNEKQKKLGRELTAAEKIDVIKEGQNFYGMMNEQLFGRSGTVTTVLRLKFMAPGFAEGNYRTILKAIAQWGQEGTWNAGRSRANIVNSLLLSVIAATAGTLALTGKPPKKPETAADVRDLFKIDTGKKDSKGRRLMIDLMTYDKDYWAVFGKPLVGQAGEVPGEIIRRLGGMTATTFEVVSDLNQLSMGKSLYDWKGDRVVEVTDPFLVRAAGLIAHEAQKVEPIATNIYRQTRDKGLNRFAAAITTLAGLRPTTSEKDKRESEIISRIFSLRDRQERLFHFLGSIKDPRKHINRYNAIAQSVLDNPITTQDMKNKWGDNLVIDVDRLIANKVHSTELLKVSDKPKPDQLDRNEKWLKNFDIPESQTRKHLVVYEMKHRALILDMKKGDADEMLKEEIARFYADKGIANRKAKAISATDDEKRLSRSFNGVAESISNLGTRLNRAVKTTERKRLYERIKANIERATK